MAWRAPEWTYVQLIQARQIQARERLDDDSPVAEIEKIATKLTSESDHFLPWGASDRDRALQRRIKDLEFLARFQRSNHEYRRLVEEEKAAIAAGIEYRPVGGLPDWAR
jgi:hypothetical protein